MNPDEHATSAAPSTPTQGVDALQSNRRVRVVLRTVLWVVAGLVVAVALVVGSVAATLPGCASCHQTGEFERNSLAQAHSKVACTTCHVKNDPGSRVSYATYEILGMVLHVVADDGRAAAQVGNDTCLSCHATVNSHVSASKGLRIKHAQCVKNNRCTDCHSATAHGASVRWPRALRMDMCLDCHAPMKVRGSCNTCHTTQALTDRLRVGSLRLTHGPAWKTAHGMGDWNTCTACHAEDSCVRCHHILLPHDADFVRTHGATALAQRSDCEVCHQKTFCSSCHGIEMPHPVSFAPTHAGTVRSKGQGMCLKCHDTSDCQTCHVKHVHPGGVTVPPKAPL